MQHTKGPPPWAPFHLSRIEIRNAPCSSVGAYETPPLRAKAMSHRHTISEMQKKMHVLLASSYDNLSKACSSDPTPESVLLDIFWLGEHLFNLNRHAASPVKLNNLDRCQRWRSCVQDAFTDPLTFPKHQRHKHFEGTPHTCTSAKSPRKLWP